ncbi:hypothetical protein VTJ83DRAFT_2722 [Remersonia thermophila]|uniref:Uncharacterized protein n=1 Tax=Remersonia thermophila TaxID=72144 RepID=A0ABR4DJI4_9PEZI
MPSPTRRTRTRLKKGMRSPNGIIWKNIPVQDPGVLERILGACCRTQRGSPTKHGLRGMAPGLTKNQADQRKDNDPEKGQRGLAPESVDNQACRQPTLKRPVVVVRNSLDISPNLTLNVYNKQSRRELYIVAAIGLILQISVVVYAGIAAYRLRPLLLNDGKPVENYAFPCTAVGTFFLVLGTLICAHVVESSTSETRLRPPDGIEIRPVWIQKHGTVNDQAFDSFGIFPETAQPLVIASHPEGEGPSGEPEKSTRLSARAITTREGMAVAGAFISICGFIAQFTGLRGMHWSVPIAQLVATLIMTILRAAVHRHLAKSPKAVPLLPHHELDWLARSLGKPENAPWRCPPGDDGNSKEHDKPLAERPRGGDNGPAGSDGGWDWSISTFEDPSTRKTLHEPPPPRLSKFQEVMMIRRDLGEMAAWPGPAAVEAAALARAIEAVMNTLFPEARENTGMTWSLPAVDSRGAVPPDSVTFRIESSGGRWRAFLGELDAALSLWLYSVKDPISTQPKGDAKGGDKVRQRFRIKEAFEKSNLRLLGRRTEALERDLHWWASDVVSRVIAVEDASQEADGRAPPWEIGDHRIVGFVPDDTPGTDAGTAGHHQPQPQPRRGYRLCTWDPPSQNALLAIESRVPLGVLYAQHMFAAFMWSAAKTLEAPIQGKTELRPLQQGGVSDDSAWQRFALQNTRLSKLAQEIQDTGLGSLDDINLSIIPPLSMTNKLPEPTPIVDLPRARAGPLEDSGHWKAATETYLRLFQQSRTLSEQSYVRTKATALLVEHHWAITFTMAMRAVLGDSVHTSDEMESMKHQVWKGLDGGAAEDVLKHIQGLYVVQGCPWDFSGHEPVQPLNVYTRRRSEPGWMENEIKNRFTDLKLGAWLIVGFTPNHLAARTGMTKTWLLIDINQKDILGWTPLHYAVLDNYSKLAGSLLQRGADSNAPDIRGQTPLHVAMAAGQDIGIVRLLLGHGADVNARDVDRITPLHYAAAREEMGVQALVERGADVSAVDAYGCTPLHWAVFSDSYESCYGTVKYLVGQAGANLEARTRSEAQRTPLELAIAQGEIDIFRALIDGGADIEARGPLGRLPLRVAVEMGHEAIVNLLLQMRADFNKPVDERKSRALHVAAENGRESCLKMLIEKGANLEATDNQGQTPLHNAACRENETCLWMLIEAGANLEAQSRKHRTPLQLAARHGKEVSVRMLIDAGANTESLTEDAADTA